MRILITGSTGFIGSHVTRLLSGDHTVGVLLRNTSNTSRINDCLHRVVQQAVQLNNKINLQSMLSNFQPDVIIHCGWEGVSKEYRESHNQISNINFTLNVLDAAIQAGVKAFIALGSQAEYALSKDQLTESSPTQPETLYGAAKLATVTMAERMAANAGIRFVWARVFSIYGPSDHPDTLISTIIPRLLRGDSVSLTSGDRLWDYLFVEDAARAISLLATSDKAEGVFNLASGKQQTIREYVEIVRDVINPQLSLEFGALNDNSVQVYDLKANVDRLREIVGWTATTSFADGIKATVDSHRSFERRISHA